MYDMIEPVNRGYTVIKREDNKKTFLCAQDLSEEPVFVTAQKAEIFKQVPECIQTVYKLAFPGDEEVSSVLFTEVISELFEWLAKGQAARRVLEQAEWTQHQISKSKAEKIKAWAAHEKRIKVFEVVFSSIDQTIKKAEAEVPKELKKYLAEIRMSEAQEATSSGSSGQPVNSGD